MIHGDVDSANVLLWGEDEHWIAKLGYYEITNLRQEYMTVNQGESNDLLALEAPIASQVESTKVDVFSYGLLLFEMYYKFPLAWYHPPKTAMLGCSRWSLSIYNGLFLSVPKRNQKCAPR